VTWEKRTKNWQDRLDKAPLSEPVKEEDPVIEEMKELDQQPLHDERADLISSLTVEANELVETMNEQMALYTSLGLISKESAATAKKAAESLLAARELWGNEFFDKFAKNDSAAIGLTIDDIFTSDQAALVFGIYCRHVVRTSEQVLREENLFETERFYELLMAMMFITGYYFRKQREINDAL